MPIQQEPLKIEIPAEEESAMVPEQSRPGVTTTITQTGQQVTDKARAAWESEQRRQAQAIAEAGARKGAAAARTGMVRGLTWLSAQLTLLAKKLEK